jgi:hypothetical protein
MDGSQKVDGAIQIHTRSNQKQTDGNLAAAYEILEKKTERLKAHPIAPPTFPPNANAPKTQISKQSMTYTNTNPSFNSPIRSL